MKKKLIVFISSKRNLILLYVLFAMLASLQSLHSGTKVFKGIEYNKYNNYTIFKSSFKHLKNDQDLYKLYPEEHWDLYKYTPTFAAFFGVLSVFPDSFGLSIWNLLNALLILAAVFYLPKLSNYEKGVILIIALIELMTSMQNSQSNGMITGFLVLAFGLLERAKYNIAPLVILLSTFIKLFGIVGFALFIFYPQKLKLIFYSIMWTLVLLLIPFLFVDLEQYQFLLKSYFGLLQNDHSTSYGYSVMGWLYSWFGFEIKKNIVVLIGILLFLVPLIRYKLFKNFHFRYLLLSSILIWIVIFNHMAESPTFVIAMTGVGLWYVKAEKNWLNNSLFLSAMVLTSLSPTDIFPTIIRESIVIPYTLKAVPCIFIWIQILYEMLAMKPLSQEVYT